MVRRMGLVVLVTFGVLWSTGPTLAGIAATVRVESLNLRASPWGSVLGILSRGDALDIAEAKWAQHPAELHTAIWYKVACDLDGSPTTGWVHSDYVTVQGSRPTATPLPPVPPAPAMPGAPRLIFAVADPEKALVDNTSAGTPAAVPPAATPPTTPPPAGTPTLAELTTKPPDWPGTGPDDPIVAWEWHFLEDDTGRPRTCTWYSHFNDWTLMRQMYPQPPWKYKNSNPVRRSGARE